MKAPRHTRTALLGLALAGSIILNAQSFTQLGQDIDGEEAGIRSGYSVSLSSDGSRLAVGAPQTASAPFSGQVEVFELVGGAWVQVGADIEGVGGGERAGSSVSLSADGHRLAIGAPFNDGFGLDAGQVRVYAEAGGVWTQVGAAIQGEAAEDRSGTSVSLSADGGRVAIGAYTNDGNGAQAGHVRVFDESGGIWTQVGGDIDGEATDDFSGHAVSLSSDGGRLAIGAYRNNGNGIHSGQVRVYEEVGGAWLQVGGDIDGLAPGEQIGWSVSLSADGGRVAIGAWGQNTRVYAENGGAWTQVGADLATGPAAVSLSADGGRLVVGSHNAGQNDSEGLTQIYLETGGSWVQLGADLAGEGAEDHSGYSVSCSSDGGRFAIGAPYNDGNGTDAGHVRVFEMPMNIAVPEHFNAGSFPIMPIPATEVLYIDVDDQAELHLFNAAGQQLLTQRLVGGGASVDVSALPSGAYVAELRTGDGRPSRFAKVLVE